MHSGAIVLSSLVLGLDTTIVVTALPTLSAKLGATTDQLQWISVAYTLALGLLLSTVASGVALNSLFSITPAVSGVAFFARMTVQISPSPLNRLYSDAVPIGSRRTLYEKGLRCPATPRH